MAGGPSQQELDRATGALREAIAANILAQAALQKQEQTALEQAVSANREARQALLTQEKVLRQTETIIESLVEALKDAQKSLADYRAHQ